jgi:hypothetical protein
VLFKNDRAWLEYEEENELFFYAVRFKPPMILEYSIRDLFNIRMYKKYALVDFRADSYIGQREIAVNRNYIVHLLTEPETR